jgi:hypothetical protein
MCCVREELLGLFVVWLVYYGFVRNGLYLRDFGWYDTFKTVGHVHVVVFHEDFHALFDGGVVVFGDCVLDVRQTEYDLFSVFGAVDLDLFAFGVVVEFYLGRDCCLSQFYKCSAFVHPLVHLDDELVFSEDEVVDGGWLEIRWFAKVGASEDVPSLLGMADGNEEGVCRVIDGSLDGIFIL